MDLSKLFAVVLALVSPSKNASPELLLKSGDSIVAMGDSITQGGGYLRYADAVLAQQYPDLKIAKILNKGISGQKAEDLIARFEKDVIANKPAVVTINIGINDVWHRLGKPHDDEVLKNYKSNVTKMVDLAQAAGIKVILLTPTVIEENADAEGNKRLTLYVDAMKQIAAEKKCGAVDLHGLFLEAIQKKPADKKTWLTSDNVHMQPLGDALMAAGMLRGLGVPDEKISATDLSDKDKK